MIFKKNRVICAILNALVIQRFWYTVSGGERGCPPVADSGYIDRWLKPGNRAPGQDYKTYTTPSNGITPFSFHCDRTIITILPIPPTKNIQLRFPLPSQVSHDYVTLCKVKMNLNQKTSNDAFEMKNKKLLLKTIKSIRTTITCTT